MNNISNNHSSMIVSDLETYANQLSHLNPTQLYREALKFQMEISWDITKENLLACQPFLQAKTINDLGCGPGDLISKLAAVFPEKIYSGYDLNTELIDVAKNLLRQRRPMVQFGTLNLLESIWPQADFIILKYVLQHIKNLDSFIEQMNRSVAKGDFVLINEAADDQVYSETKPTIAQWKMAMKELAAKQKEHGGNRNVIEDFLKNTPSHWHVLEDRVINLEVCDDARLEFAKYILAGGNLLPHFFGMNLNRNKLKDEVIHWFLASNSSGFFKFRWVLLKRVEH